MPSHPERVRKNYMTVKVERSRNVREDTRIVRISESSIEAVAHSKHARFQLADMMADEIRKALIHEVLSE